MQDPKSILIIAPERTGSSVFSYVLSKLLKTVNNSCTLGKGNYETASKLLRNAVFKIPPAYTDKKTFGKLIGEADVSAVLLRSNLRDVTTSYFIAHRTKFFDGKYTVEDEFKDYLINPDSKHIFKILEQYIKASSIAFKYNIPIIFYEDIYSGDKRTVDRVLKNIGINLKKTPVDREFLPIFYKLLHPDNKYTEENSAWVDTKTPIKEMINNAKNIL